MAHRRTISPRKSKPNTSWTAAISSQFISVPAGSRVLLAGLAPSNPGIDETIFRVIGHVTVVSDQTQQVETQVGSVGLIVVSAEAIFAGSGSVPGPSSQANNDGWFCHLMFAQKTKGSNDNAPAYGIYPFESKGRRIVNEGSQIAVMAENIHLTEGMSVNVQFRILSRVTGS